MTNTVFAPISTQSIIHLGAPQVGAKVYFYGAGGSTPRSIWTDKNATIAASNPVIADGDGVIPPIWVSGTADYRIVVKTAADVLIRTIENLQGATAEVTGGGGGTSSYALVTGDIKINLDTAEQSGFVKLNGNSIGNSGSGAHYADDLLTDLFTYLWNRVSDTWCPVSGGRGANAAADFVAGKQLTLPDGRFRTFRGLSGMGASTSALAVDYAGASNPGFQGGGNRKTLATGNLPSHTHTGTTAGGSGTIAGNTSTDGAHVHTGAATDTAPDHSHSYQIPSDVAVNVGATATVTFKATSATASTGGAGTHSHAVTVPNTSSTHAHAVSLDPATHTHGFNTDATGSGTPVDVITPFLAGTFYMKT
jgi:hypothetical protein